MYQHHFHDHQLKSKYLQDQSNPVHQDLKEAIDREYETICFYNELALLSTDIEIQEQAILIRNEEQLHLNEFSNFYFKLTNQVYQPKQTELGLINLSNAIHTAFQQEQQSAKVYLDIADRIKNPYFKDRFKRIAADELRHANWMLYFIANIKGAE
ncbi:ferritin family protein [Alkalibacillus haloalkaliphilus]|uniref:ferritin family protein n=1 Tax=Alkalibacillus haloalkaliphilus TaxID=94136 RepID=UPI002935645E|nr:ferritin family protein [Alkalibacillus haloalkaliphilus]MDV2581962.1 ferritin family protein [Alkalibacillus haloalkaliphilus]